MKASRLTGSKIRSFSIFILKRQCGAFYKKNKTDLKKKIPIGLGIFVLLNDV